MEHAFNTSPQFTLQKLWFYIHPTVHTLSLIYQLVLELANTDDDEGSSLSSSSADEEQDARDEALGLGGAKLKAVLSEITKSSGAAVPVKGGEVLTVIYERMQGMSGDPTACKVYGTLLSAAGIPYAQMLREWITTGRLHDPHEEFCVKESKFISKGILEVDYTDEYWERRYTVSLCIDRYCSYLLTMYSYGMVPPRRRNGSIPVSHHPGLPVADFQAVHVFLPHLKGGNTRSSSLGNTSMSFVNAV